MCANADRFLKSPSRSWRRALWIAALALIALPGGIAGEAVAGASSSGGASSAPTEDVSAKEAFDAAKQLDTSEGWNAFLARHPNGFLSELARAYVQKLSGPNAPSASPPAGPAETYGKAQSNPVNANPVAATLTRPAAAVARGAQFMGFPEKFNRYYSDPNWLPRRPSTSVRLAVVTAVHARLR